MREQVGEVELAGEHAVARCVEVAVDGSVEWEAYFRAELRQL